MIAVIDTGGANLSSVLFAFERLGQKAVITSDPKTILSAPRVILPGVGAAKHSMNKLKDSGLVELIRGLKQPVMGICLGMQLLFESSEEGDAKTLGILPERVRRIEDTKTRVVPHMGWNQVSWKGPTPKLFEGIENGSHFYFVHSFVAPQGPWVDTVFSYEGDYPAAVSKDNFYGVQFHPERSADAGAQLLRNFIKL